MSADVKTDNRKLTREEMAWKMAKEYAKNQAEVMYPDPIRREREEPRIAHDYYLRLMYP